MKELNEIGSGGGCILAHCMGLGKTLTSICFTLTLLSSPLMTKIVDPLVQKETKDNEAKRKTEEKLQRRNARKDQALLKDGMVNGSDGDDEDDSEDNESIGLPAFMLDIPIKKLFHKILILAPVNTVQNWFDEYNRWTPAELKSYTKVRLLTSAIKIVDRMRVLRAWSTEGGILILGYELFRTLTGNSDDSVSISGTKSNSKKSLAMKSGKAQPQGISPSLQAEARRWADEYRYIVCM